MGTAGTTSDMEDDNGKNKAEKGGENDESRGGETEESRGGETEESRGGETKENKESSGDVREKAGKKKKGERRQRMQQKRGKRVSEEGLPGGKTVKVDDMRERGHASSVQQERSFADVVSQGKARKARVFVGDSIIRKVDKIVNRGDDITVCLPGAKVEDIAEKAGQVMGGGTGGAVLVHVGTNNAEKEGTSSIVDILISSHQVSRFDVGNTMLVVSVRLLVACSLLSGPLKNQVAADQGKAFSVCTTSCFYQLLTCIRKECPDLTCFKLNESGTSLQRTPSSSEELRV
ncbi:hypothetical protein LSAT2_001869 [Lamellibrachia satsuma]|nr:hypothetical protein LSAT2_001869 [Lamellibrachia satsuma]